jgi:multicomponent Na+:H+ antiporter subunit D
VTGSLLPLLVVVPLFGAAVGALAPGSISRLMLVLSPVLTTAGGVALLVTHGDTPVLAHNVGGFVPGSLSLWSPTR